MTNSQIDLTSDLVIDMSTPDQMAIATQHDDGYAASRINASGRMLINGSGSLQRWANQSGYAPGVGLDRFLP